METLLRFVPMDLDSPQGLFGSFRCPPGLKPVVNTSTSKESTQTNEASAPPVAKASPSKNGFSKLEERAVALGIKMAQQGFAHGDNPYTGLNVRLEAVWLTSFSKYQAAVRTLGH